MAGPAADRRASGFGVRGSWTGGRESEGEQTGRGGVTHTSDAPKEVSVLSRAGKAVFWGWGVSSDCPAREMGLWPQGEMQGPEVRGRKGLRG